MEKDRALSTSCPDMLPGWARGKWRPLYWIWWSEKPRIQVFNNGLWWQTCCMQIFHEVCFQSHILTGLIVPKRCTFVWYGCCNITTNLVAENKTHFLMVLEDRGPKPVSLDWNHELVGPFMPPLEALRETLFSCQHSLASGCINPNPASSSLSLWSQMSLYLSFMRTPVMTVWPSR